MIVAMPIAALLLAAYVLVNALDLGVGLLLPLLVRGRDRDAVVGGGGRPWLTSISLMVAVLALLLAGLPGSLRPLWALSPVLLVLVAALMVRAGAATARRHVLRQDLCDLTLGLSSLLALLCQGAALGWFLGDLATGEPARYAGALGWVSIWGGLGATAVVGLCALFGASWLIHAGRGAIRVFGREVARAAVLLFGAAAPLCALWAVVTGVEARLFTHGWVLSAVAAALATAALGLLFAFELTRWRPRAAVPAGCGLLSGLLALAAIIVVLFPFAPTPEIAKGSFASHLAILLLLGAPAVVADVLGRVRTLGAAEVVPAQAGGRPSHAGCRSGALASGLHLS